MDEDDEFRPEATGSPTSPHSDGRITVTVAAMPPPQNNLTLALPIQQHKPSPSNFGSGVGGGGSGGGGGGGGGGGREDCWSEGATAVLIDAWGERYLQLSRGNLKQTHWRDVADIVSSREDYTKTPKTDIQCKNRIDTVKKKYKLEKAKMECGGPPSKWVFFHKLDQLIGQTAKAKINPSFGSSIPSGNVMYPAASHKVPMGIPIAGLRSSSASASQFGKPRQDVFRMKKPFKGRAIMDSDSEPDPDSADDFPPPTSYKRPRVQREIMNVSTRRQPPGTNNRGNDGAKIGGGKERRDWGDSVRELTQAILKLGEAYEQAETSKLQQLVEMEKQRMKFAKEMELQRMQFFMKTQLELSQLKKQRRDRNGDKTSNRHHHRTSNKNDDAIATGNSNMDNNNSGSSE